MKDIRLGSYRTTHGRCTCLYWEGTRFIHILTIEFPMTVHKRLKSEAKFISPLAYKGKPYPMIRALKIFRRACKRGGSKSARKLIGQAAKELHSEAITSASA